MKEEQQKKLLTLVRSVVDLLDAEEHLGWDATEKKYYCRGYCEVGTCPGVELEKFLRNLQE